MKCPLLPLLCWFAVSSVRCRIHLLTSHSHSAAALLSILLLPLEQCLSLKLGRGQDPLHASTTQLHTQTSQVLLQGIVS